MLTSWFYCSRLLWQPKAAIQSWACAVSGNLRHFEHDLRQTTAPGLNESCLLGAMNMFATRCVYASMRPCFHCSLSRCLCVSVSPHCDMSLSVYLYLLCTQASVWLSSMRPRICPSIHTSVRQCICMRVRLFVSSSVSVCISVCMSVCLCAWLDADMQKSFLQRNGDKRRRRLTLPCIVASIYDHCLSSWQRVTCRSIITFLRQATQDVASETRLRRYRAIF